MRQQGVQRGPVWLAAGALAGVAMALLIATTGRSFAATASPVYVSPNQPAGVDVTGMGKVTVVPDVAVVNLGVEARAATVEAARDQSAQVMDALIKSLTGNGVDKKDIQTRSLNISPEWSNRSPNDQQPRISGYIVSNQVSVKIRQLAKVTQTVDAAVAAGGNNMRMHGIQFVVDDPTAAMKQARDAAMTDAKSKAEQLARLAGVNIGRPIHIVDHVTGGPAPMFDKGVMRSSAGAAEMAQTPIEPGQSEVQMTIQATFSIE